MKRRLRPEAKLRRGLPAPQHAWPAADSPCVSAGAHRCRWRVSLSSLLGRLSGSKMTKVGIASINDGGMQRSQLIDQQAIPLLEQEAMQAQSASIQGVSGASYTSAGFQQSLQGALQTLGFK